MTQNMNNIRTHQKIEKGEVRKKIHLKIKTKKKGIINMKNQKNTLGTIGLCMAFISPIAGLILGIIALAKQEKTPTLGILAIIFSVLNFIVGIMIFALW